MSNISPELNIKSAGVRDYFERLDPKVKYFILVDENTLKYCLPILIKQILKLENAEVLCINPGENQKDLGIVAQMWESLTEYEADRSSVFISVGGGVVTDLGGFIASTFKRGIPFIHIPTTLLGMVDAAIGGKNGINFQSIKNHIGTFNEPDKIIIEPSFLSTLPELEIRSGQAEMIKHGLIASRKHFEDTTDPHVILTNEKLIQESSLIKQTIVSEDFREQNKRMFLNYGHTIGHAIERISLENKKPIPHGYAIAYGMCIENEIAVAASVMNKETKDGINKKIMQFYPPLSEENMNTEAIIRSLRQDKKKVDDELKFALISEPEHCDIYRIEESTIKTGLGSFKK